MIKRFYLAGFGLVLLIVGLIGYQIITYAYDSPRMGVRMVSVSGAVRVSEGEVLARAGYVPGVSSLRLDLDEMRGAVEGIPWVRNASVQRVWPNELVISIVERTPIALARIDGQIFQVDREGVVLPTDGATGVDVPILDGIRTGATETNASKIGVYTSIVEGIGDTELSEVHINEAGEVSVVPTEDPILVDLGSVDHFERWQRFLALRELIREDYPGASRVDLRFRDQVIVKSRETPEAGINIWGEEEKL